MAYQLDRPDLGQGMVVALRRPKSPYYSARFVLRGLDESANYEVSDLDTGTIKSYSGKELAQAGLEVVLKRMPDSSLLVYKRK